jgi:hypothetical protein
MNSTSASPRAAAKRRIGAFDALMLNLKLGPDCANRAEAAKAQVLRSVNRFRELEAAMECRDAYGESKNPWLVDRAKRLARNAMAEGSPDIAEAIYLILYGMTKDIRYAKAAVSISETIVPIYRWELPEPVSDGGHKRDKGQ